MKFVLRFSRKTSSVAFIPEIDGMRFFAIATVVIFHLNTAFAREMGLTLEKSVDLLGGKDTFSLGAVINRLDLGVKVFFAISGFILALPFINALKEDKKVDIFSYFKRRLTRLEPPFIISLLMFSLVHIIVFHEKIGLVMKHFLVGLGYSHSIFFGEPNFINPVTWSLETEAQFYIIVPLLFVLLRLFKKPTLKITLLILIFSGSMIFKNIYSTNGYIGTSVLAYFVNFLVGIFFASFYVNNKSYFEISKRVIFDLLGVLSIFGMFIFYKPQAQIQNILLFNLSILSFFFAVFLGKYHNRFFVNKWIYTIGGMCYSIYLLHYAFFHLLVKFSKQLALTSDYGVNLGIQIIIGLPIILAISIVFFTLVERPCMNPEWPKLLKLRINQILKK
jgi:peptidoglycan/LPS O-acetylase OafA/YrhL